MIKKILAWITGKSDTTVAEAAPYKVEAQKVEGIPLGIEAVMVVPSAVVPAAIETTPVTVKAKYKKSELNNMNKTELMALIEKHSIEVKTRITKDELIKILMKV
jgi:hypothetical protein